VYTGGSYGEVLHPTGLRPENCGGVIKLGASAGIATTRSRNYWTPEDLVQNADTALYLAKAAGRGVACIFTPIPS
jgi:predicted signal transduction protein with EAL and GGDEF domain